jgi:small subunit ribosomal protein S6
MASILRHYELTYILRPDTQPADKAAILDRLQNTLTNTFESEVLRVEEWGKRALAYPMAKQTQGQYIYLRMLARPDAVSELERQLRLNDQVIKFLTVKLEKGADTGRRPDQEVNYDTVDGDDEEE